MRPLEILLFVLTLLSLLVFWIPAARRSRWSLALPVAGVLAAVLHLALEKPRWQMIPVYLFLLALVLLSLRGWNRGGRQAVNPGYPRRGWVIAGVLLWVVALLPPALFPVPVLPAPTGPYMIGTRTFSWEDSSRTESLAPQPVSSPRRLNVQVWYPAEPAKGAKTAAYMQSLDVALPAVSKELNLPPWLLTHIGLVKTNSYPDAPLSNAAAKYPVLIFSHGWDGMRTQNTFQMEELASQGYVVFAPDHTYGAGFTVFPDGSVALNNPALLPEGVPDDEYQRDTQRVGEAWVGDLHFVMDQVEALQTGKISSPFAGHLDVEHTGFLGHSTGGGAAVQACWSDSRCKAGLSMDAWLVPYSRDMLQEGLHTPFLFMNSEGWSSKGNAPLMSQMWANSTQNIYWLRIAGTKHYDFTDIPLMTPLAPMIGLKGPINGQRQLYLVNTYTLAFFDHYLKDLPAPLLNGPSADFTEVNFEKK